MGYKSAQIPFNTKNLAVHLKHVCAYCGKELEPDREWDDGYNDETYYHCDCEPAKKEIELLKKEDGLRYQLDIVRRQINEIKPKFFIHEYELYSMDDKINTKNNRNFPQD